MKTNIMIGTYNNYFNRIVKVDDYQSILTAGANWILYPDINFNPSDNVNTSLILNFNAKETNYGNFDPDYLLVLDDNNTISQRWFIMDLKRTRNGQYNFTLRRDLLADYKRDILDATTFIEKGFVTTDNPLIFNKEDCTFNQIKQSEIPLRDKTANGWIVGYLAPNIGLTTDPETGEVSAEDKVVEINYQQEIIPDISTFEYTDYIGTTIKGMINKNTSYFWMSARKTIPGRPSSTSIKRYLNGTGETGISKSRNDYRWITVDNVDGRVFADTNINFPMTHFNSLISSNPDFENIINERNKIYKDGNTYKKVVLSSVKTVKSSYSVTESNNPALVQSVKNTLINNGYTFYQEYDYNTNDMIECELEYGEYILKLEEVGSPITNAKITFKNTSRTLEDAPYKMFCIPVADNAVLEVGDTRISMNKNRMIQIASSIATGLKSGTDGFLYDIQLLPYSPIPNDFVFLTDVNGSKYIYQGTEGIDYDVVYNNDVPEAYIFYCSKSSFTTDVFGIGSIYYPDLNINNPIDFKANSEAYKFRIVSPNFANMDDFNYYMNYGLDYFNVDCTYKPITPYIKININYKGLYGQDFNDNRGLVLGGDFSLPVISDSWINYQIQNKNYSNIFDRETQNLEHKRKWERISETTGALTGSIGAAVMGGSFGGAAGAIGAGAGSLIAGAVDAFAAEELYKEGMDYRKDLYKLHLQNIQALPQGLIKTSAFNYNSRIWPFVEIYKSTDIEIEAFKNKLKYNGMTLGVIGQVKNYLNPSDLTYIQGKIIRLTSISEDYHIVSEINKELNMGVYL